MFEQIMCPFQVDNVHADDLPLKSMEIDMRQESANLQIDFRLKYNNKNNGILVDAKLTMPMDTDMAVSDVYMSANNKTFISRAEEKYKASDIFQEKKSENKTALLIERQSDRMIIHLCSIPSGADIDITFSLYAALQTKFDPLTENFYNKITLPLTLFPRYTPQKTIEEEQIPKDTIGQPTYNFKFKYVLPKDSTLEENSKLKEFVVDKNTIVLNSVPTDDFNAKVYINEKVKSTKEIFGKSQVVNFKLNPLEILKESKSNPKSFVFLLDCSGSMNFDDRITNVRKAMPLFLHSLPVGCTFDIVRFGTMASSFNDYKLQPYNDESLSKAEAYVSRINADMGGTEIYQPLSKILDELQPEVVFVLTDGAVSNIEQVTELAKRSKSHIFTLGVGAGADMNLVRSIARFSGGTSEFVSNSDEIQSAVIRLLDNAVNPILSNLEIKSDCGQLMQLTPFSIPRNSYFELSYMGENKECSVTIKGKSSKGEQTFKLSSADAELLDSTKFLHSIAVNRAANDGVVDQNFTVQHAKPLNLMTKYTSLILYDDETKHENIHQHIEVEVPVQMFSRVAHARMPRLLHAKAAQFDTNNFVQFAASNSMLQHDTEDDLLAPPTENKEPFCEKISRGQSASGSFKTLKDLINEMKFKSDKDDEDLYTAAVIAYLNKFCSVDMKLIARKAMSYLESKVGADQAKKLVEKAEKLIKKVE